MIRQRYYSNKQKLNVKIGLIAVKAIIMFTFSLVAPE